ncbi:hypothetical protein [Labrenzia sp. PHM005]|uniref:hypothetical protein n=1 Tax=Labrenzia sp. PHM005 TaxID=2590016 RepID=UPI001140550F|nr:hypothetical protein [Labrenzia sp. PHM005]QDG76545.1 hypothetical protein FJ695_12050 [Labrenzia sp. PHM005]
MTAEALECQLGFAKPAEHGMPNLEISRRQILVHPGHFGANHRGNFLVNGIFGGVKAPTIPEIRGCEN